MIDPGLDGKVVLVTGGNNPHGIGAAAARAFAAQGAVVFVHYFRGPGLSDMKDPPATPGERFYRQAQAHDAGHVIEMIRAAGGRGAAWEADLSDPGAVFNLFDRVEAALGPVQVLVNNAAISDADTFLPKEARAPGMRAADGFLLDGLTAESHDRNFAVNARAPALAMAEFARRHLARRADWGRIVNISTDGAHGFATEVSYGASKHALESYSRAAAQELGPFGITVNIVSLGPIQTGWITPDMEAAIAGRTPLGRVGRPEDVAAVIVFLASDQAGWLTGQHLYAGGGHRMPL